MEKTLAIDPEYCIKSEGYVLGDFPNYIAAKTHAEHLVNSCGYPKVTVYELPRDRPVKTFYAM